MDEIIVYYGWGQTAKFMSWSPNRRSDTLVLWAHGMQHHTFFAPMRATSLPPANYAFTIPFDSALFNPGFTNPENWPKLRLYVNRFLRERNQFRSQTPLHYIYPFLEPDDNIVAALNDLAEHNLCEILYFTGLATLGNPVDYITFEQLLRAQVPHEGMTFAQRYSSFLLLTCRSNARRGIGMGGAPPTSPNGLYRADQNRVIYIP
ncbi:MAG TPA: hypothetical protein VGD58_13145 [Herpetosiphonaceae bacterium]